MSPDTPDLGPDPGPDPGPDLSIVVPHLNQPDYLAAFLKALHAQFDMSRVEVIVVDNGSRALPRAVVAPYPGVRLVEEPTPGPGPARNRGVAVSRGALLAFTDADVLPAPDWLPRLLARFEDPDLAILGGDIRVFAADPADPSVAEAYECVYAFPQADYIARQKFSVSANLATRRSVFDAVGPFAGIEIAEDTDWGQRAARLGYRTVYAPEVVVQHPARRTLAELYAKWDRNVSHHYEAFARGPAGKAKWLAKAIALGVSPLLAIPRIARSDRLSGARSRRRAFRGLLAVRLYRARKMLAVMLDSGTRTASTGWNRQ
jgi:GT2 family glycosyltransferase